jgi:hypothetical protein
MRGHDRLQPLPAHVSEINIGSESRGTHDRILLFKVRYFANLEGHTFITQEQGDPVIPPDTVFASRHLQGYC